MKVLPAAHKQHLQVEPWIVFIFTKLSVSDSYAGITSVVGKQSKLLMLGKIPVLQLRGNGVIYYAGKTYSIITQILNDFLIFVLRYSVEKFWELTTCKTYICHNATYYMQKYP